MNDGSLKESVSALVDGESNDMDLQRVLNSVDKGSSQREEVRTSWQRYQSIGDVMRGEYQYTSSMDISSSVRAALEEESVATPVTSVSRPSFWRNLTGKTAIAATVAFAVVLGVQEFSGISDEVSGGAETVANTSGAVVPKGFEQPNVNTRTVSASKTVPASQVGSYGARSLEGTASSLNNEQLMREKMDKLLLLHAKQASEASSLGVLPYARTNQLEDKN